METAAEERFPVVLVNRTSGNPHVHYIATDHYQGVYSGIEYLAATGHRNIALIGGPFNEEPYKERLHGYIEALKNNNIPFNEDLVLDIRYSLQSFDRIFMFLERKVFSAILINGEAFILPVLNALKTLRKRIPYDVSVVCFDSIKNSFDYYGPPLTSIVQPVYQMGKIAIQIFLDRIYRQDAGSYAVKKQTIVPELVIRQSCKKNSNFRAVSK